MPFLPIGQARGCHWEDRTWEWRQCGAVAGAVPVVSQARTARMLKRHDSFTATSVSWLSLPCCYVTSSNICLTIIMSSALLGKDCLENVFRDDSAVLLPLPVPLSFLWLLLNCSQLCFWTPVSQHLSSQLHLICQAFPLGSCDLLFQ